MREESCGSRLAMLGHVSPFSSRAGDRTGREVSATVGAAAPCDADLQRPRVTYVGYEWLCFGVSYRTCHVSYLSRAVIAGKYIHRYAQNGESYIMGSKH